MNGFAKGGIVRGPIRAIVSEGYIIPRSQADALAEVVPVSAHTFLGSLTAALPDCEADQCEERGAGLVAYVSYGGGRFRVQIDPVGDQP